MRSFRLVVISSIVVVSSFSAMWGCAGQPKPTVVTAAPTTQPVATVAESGLTPATQPVPADPSDLAASTPDLLAQHAAAYARNLEPLLATRPSPQAPREQPPVADETLALPGDDAVAIDGPVATEAPGAAKSAPTTQRAQASRPTTRLKTQSVDVDQEPVDSLAPDTRAADSNPSPEATTDALFARLQQRTKDYPKDVAVHLDFQLLQFLREEKVPTLPELSSLPAEDREVLAALLDSLSNFRNGIRRDNNMLLSSKIEPLLELAERLRSRAELTVPTVALCSKVNRFGVYEPMPAEFTAGKPHKTVVYCEVENFSSQLNDKKQWETKLKPEIVLYTETGLPVWQAQTQLRPDASRNRRNDFFLAELIELPGTLTIGRYLLKVSVIDQTANRIAEATLPVRVTAGRAGNDEVVATPPAAPAPSPADADKR